ncbi:MAG: hypothetical protein WCQ64_06400 [Acidobacteriota bacterium]
MRRGTWLAGIAVLVLLGYSGAAAQDAAVVNDGSTKETTYVAGDTIYREPLTHWAENIGKTTIHLMVYELKK